MRYLALGDSISIDDYTGVPGGGAASQFARLIGATEFESRTHDGCTTDGVLAELALVEGRPDIVTLTAGGNDFLQAAFWMGGQRVDTPALWSQVVRRPLHNLQEIARRLATYHCPVIVSTIYDPSDGDDELATAVGVVGLPEDFRTAFDALNDGIRALAKSHGFILADLQTLFRGHGIQSSETWITGQIEPNHPGATAISQYWHDLYRGSTGLPAG